MNERLQKLIDKLNEKKAKIAEKEKAHKESEKKKKIEKEKLKREKSKERKKKLRKEKIKKKKTISKYIVEKEKKKRGYYMIIITSHKKQIEELYKCSYRDTVYKKYNNYIDENKNKIVFPIKYIANKNISRGIVESDYEILLMKIKKDEDNNTVKLRNEYGQMVDHIITDSDKWVILDKHEYLKEETFWVYGYNPRTQRKNFNFILNEILLNNINDKNYFKRIMIFKNKLIIQYDFDIDMILCKNNEDAIRLYTELENIIKKEKVKNIFFNGIVSNSNRDWVIDLIGEKTNWDYQKIIREKTAT